jgi:hypothetical protein
VPKKLNNMEKEHGQFDMITLRGAMLRVSDLPESDLFEQQMLCSAPILVPTQLYKVPVTGTDGDV